MIIPAALLTACGGGSSGNPSRPPFQLQLIHSGVAFSGDTYEIRISGGQAPYSFQSSNEYVISDKNIDSQGDDRLYLVPSAVDSEVMVELIITDKNKTSAAAMITVRPSYLYPGNIYVTPDDGAPEECSSQGTSVGVETEGYASICVGASGTAQVVLRTSDGVSVANREIRFEWAGGEYYFPDSTAYDQKSITEFTDSTGKASVRITARSNAKTHLAFIKATEVSSGQSVRHAFMITTQALSVFPTEITIQVPGCASVSDTISVFGGQPPYTVIAGDGITASPSVIPEVGGSSRLTTTAGWCFDVDILVRDSAGSEVNVDFTVQNVEVAEPEEPEVPELKASSAWNGGTVDCSAGTSFGFNVTGGVSPYRFTLSGSAVAPSTPPLYTYASVAGNTGAFTFDGPTYPPSGASYTVSVIDSAGTDKMLTLACQ